MSKVLAVLLLLILVAGCIQTLTQKPVTVEEVPEILGEIEIQQNTDVIPEEENPFPSLI